LLRHVLVNLIPLIIVMVSIAIGGAILIEAGLSFLGLGVPPPAVSWGRMIGSDSRAYFSHAPWLAVFPGIALSLTIFAFNVLGDALRDQLDPRLRGQR
jgi:peptide/nickel transport system permease protein